MLGGGTRIIFWPASIRRAHQETSCEGRARQWQWIPSLRDRLCLLIRQHRLDPARVKAYAADYCDVAELRQASREQVAAFIKHLAEYSQSDREGLLCQLNSYAPKPVSAVPVATPIDRSSEMLTAEQEKATGAA